MNGGDPETQQFLNSFGGYLFMASWSLAFVIASIAGFLYRHPRDRRTFAELTVLFGKGEEHFEPRGVLLLRIAFGLAAIGGLGLLMAVWGREAP